LLIFIKTKRIPSFLVERGETQLQHLTHLEPRRTKCNYHVYW